MSLAEDDPVTHETRIDSRVRCRPRPVDSRRRSGQTEPMTDESQPKGAIVAIGLPTLFAGSVT